MQNDCAKQSVTVSKCMCVLSFFKEVEKMWRMSFYFQQNTILISSLIDYGIYVIFCREQLITDPQDLSKPIICICTVRRQNIVAVKNVVLKKWFSEAV